MCSKRRKFLPKNVRQYLLKFDQNCDTEYILRSVLFEYYNDGIEGEVLKWLDTEGNIETLCYALLSDQAKVYQLEGVIRSREKAIDDQKIRIRSYQLALENEKRKVDDLVKAIHDIKIVYEKKKKESERRVVKVARHDAFDKALSNINHFKGAIDKEAAIKIINLSRDFNRKVN